MQEILVQCNAMQCNAMQCSSMSPLEGLLSSGLFLLPLLELAHQLPHQLLTVIPLLQTSTGKLFCFLFRFPSIS